MILEAVGAYLLISSYTGPQGIFGTRTIHGGEVGRPESSTGAAEVLDLTPT